MLKKLIGSSAILMFSSSVAFANSTSYVGAGIGVQNPGAGNGITGNAFAGIGTKLGPNEKVYLGGEVSANVSSQPKKYGLALSFIPGLMVTPKTMAYARVGEETYRYSGTSATYMATQLGLGLQTELTKDWSIRGEYVNTASNVFHNVESGHNNRVNVGLIYKIN